MVNVIYFDELDSTNGYLKSNLSEYKHGDCIVANNQTAGRGQLGTEWVSKPHENLTCSFLIDWSKVKVANQFQISKLVAIVVLSEIKALVPEKEVKIKWPNDIYIENSKVAGILIENTISNGYIDKSIVGIGINVNQTRFPDFNGKQVTSLKMASEEDADKINIYALVKRLGDNLLEEVSMGRIHDLKTLNRVYLNYLLGYRKELRFQDKDGEFVGCIKGIDPQGRLMIEDQKRMKVYDLKEITFIL